VLAAVTRSPGQMVVDDVSGPGCARAGNVIVRPETVGICGSDFHLYSGDVGALSGIPDFYPRIQGHEVSAIVEDPGTAVAVARGDRVAIWPLLPCGGCYPCRSGRPNVCVSIRLIGVHLDGGLQQRLEVPASAVFGVGDLDPDRTALVEPASVVVHALARARPLVGEQVAVFGAGPIGLITVLAAAAAGARVLAIDPVSARRDLARRLGAEQTCGTGTTAAVREWTSGTGPPLVIDTSGDPGVLARAVDLVSAAGRVVVVGMTSASGPLRPGVFPEKEIDVLGSSCATADDFRAAILLVRARRAALAALCSHRFPLARAAEAIEFAMRRPPDAIKVMVTIPPAR
jgi:threonine dehydrogenase-like Zn-dependent dehydrogenase